MKPARVDFPRGPYPETVQDEVSGIIVDNPLHAAWRDGLMAGIRYGLMTAAGILNSPPEDIAMAKRKLGLPS